MGTSFGGLSVFAGVAALALVACSGKSFTSVVDDGGGPEDGGTTTADGAPGLEAGPPVDGGVPLPCGGSACGVLACCVTPTGSNKFASNCAATCPPSNGKTPTTLKCLSNANCVGGVCCIAKQSDGITSSCVLDFAGCSRAGGQPLCEMGGAPSQCSGAQPCSTESDSNWQIPTSLGTCSGH
jgi:hypothetical protein